jgi:hypothetical protein
MSWPTTCYGTFSSCKLLVDSKNLLVLYLWRSVQTTTGHIMKRIEKILKFYNFCNLFFNLVVKVDFPVCKPCTFLESASNLLSKKLQVLGQPKMLARLCIKALS